MAMGMGAKAPAKDLLQETIGRLIPVPVACQHYELGASIADLGPGDLRDCREAVLVAQTVDTASCLGLCTGAPTGLQYP
jgi:hypothetical protein